MGQRHKSFTLMGMRDSAVLGPLDDLDVRRPLGHGAFKWHCYALIAVVCCHVLIPSCETPSCRVSKALQIFRMLEPNLRYVILSCLSICMMREVFAWPTAGWLPCFSYRD